MMTRMHQCIVVAALIAGHAMAQTDTTFTYQGSLAESGEPANGSYNMDFALWDALSGGNQVGSTIEFNGLTVTDGLFTVELDYGAGVFDGTQLWLEISVDGTELVPRQPITGTPYAIQTRGIFVNDAGNVGIGTTNPLWEFEVANLNPGDGAESAVTADDAGGAIAAYSSSLPPPFEHLGGRVSLFANTGTGGLDVRADNANGDIRFYSGGLSSENEKMRISPNGHVSIGLKSTPYKLHVVAENTIAVYAHSEQNRAIMGHSGGSDGGTGLFGFSSAVVGTNYGVRGQCNSTNGYDFYAEGSGQDYGSSSSIRWKRNIEPINGPLDKVSRLRGVYFDWDADHGGHHDVGMIAEEVGEVLPEIVAYEENGVDAHGMDYSKLTPLLVEAVNALRTEKDKEVAALQYEMDALRRRNIDLDERIARLEAMIVQLLAEKEAAQ